MKHTKEPLTVKLDIWIGDNGHLMVNHYNTEFMISRLDALDLKAQEVKGILQHIVSCVNALEGINPEAVQQVIAAVAGYVSFITLFCDANSDYEQKLVFHNEQLRNALAKAKEGLDDTKKDKSD